jgi:O-antigen/teichoic acid export membrane protein
MKTIIRKIFSTILADENKHFYNALFFGTLSAVISQGLNFLTLMLITRKIGESGIGHFSIIQSTVIMLLTFGILGQNVSQAVLISRFKKNNPESLGLLVGNAYLLSLIMMTIIGIFTFLTAEYLFREIFLDYSIKIFSTGLIILWTTAMTFDIMQISTLIGLQAYRDLIKTDILKGIISIAVIYPLTIKFGLLGTLPGYLLSSFLGLLTNQFFIRKHLRLLNVGIVWRFSVNIIHKILNIGLPIFLASLFIGFATWYTNKIIFNESFGPAALGIVFVCRQIMTLIQFIPVQISKVLLPIISEDTKGKGKSFIMNNSLVVGVSVCLILSVLGLIFEDKILLIYKLNPLIASLPYKVILITVVFSSINMILGQFVVAGRNPWVRTFADIVISFILIAGTLLFKAKYIYIALPLAMLISYFSGDILLAIYLRGKKLPESIIDSEAD